MNSATLFIVVSNVGPTEVLTSSSHWAPSIRLFFLSFLSIYNVYQSILSINLSVYQSILSICLFYSVYLRILFCLLILFYLSVYSIYLFCLSIYSVKLSCLSIYMCILFYLPAYSILHIFFYLSTYSIYLLILCNLSAYSILSITLIYGLLHPIIHPSILPKKKFTQLVSKFFLFHFRQRCRFVWSARVALKEATTANTAPSAASNVSFFALILIMQKLCERLALWNKWFSFAWRRWIQSHSARDSPWWHSNKLLFFYLLLCTTTSSTADAELFA